MEPTDVAIIIPAFNEENTIYNVVKNIYMALGNDINIIVVNDCSNDSTSIKAKEAGAKVLDLKSNHGYSKAIEVGIKSALENLDVKFLMTMDADGQHNAQSLKEIIKKAYNNNSDVVVGYRPKFARYSEVIYSIYFRLRYKIIDPLSGLKLYKTTLIREFGCFETFDSIGTEILTYALEVKKNVEQVPIKINDREGTKPRFGSGWKPNLRIILSLLLLIKKYR